MNICVLIRVYDRIDDLLICINTIKKFWKRNNYYLLVISNGIKDGFIIPDEVKLNADKVIELKKNAGHIKGNSQLLNSGLEEIPTNCKYTVLLEADTWVFTDKILDRYIIRCMQSGAVWASAEWLPNYYSLAVDLAIAESDFIKKNKDIFSFTIHAESYVYNYLKAKEANFIKIREHSPIHFPKILRYFPKFKGRIYYSVKGKIVSHHTELLPNGMESKKRFANIITNQRTFDKIDIKFLSIRYVIVYFFSILLKIAPKKQWILKKKIRLIDK